MAGAAIEVLTLERERLRRDAHHFIFGAGVLKTKDEHDPREAVKVVPDVPYLRALLDCYLVSGGLVDAGAARWAREAGIPESFLMQLGRTGVLFVEKSRDMYVTNLTCCYLLWRGRALDHQLILVQSKREEDAAGLVFTKEPQYARLSFMESQLPGWARAMEFPRAGAYGNLYAPNGSHFRAIPEGAHIIRSEHPSVIFSDEAAFQAEFGAAYTAALPAVEGGGQLLAVSSAEAGAFEELVEADKGVTVPTKIPGLGWRLASETVPVLRLHYAADPAKRPGTPAGESWRARAALRYTGGTRSPRWRKEMEIEYRAFGGLKVFPEWAEAWSQGPPFVIPSFRPVGYRLYGSYDHGWNNPAAFHVHGVGADSDKVTLWEFYADRVPLSSIAAIIQGKPTRTPPRPDARIDPGKVVFEGNPFAGELAWIVADPSLWAEDQPMTDEPNKSTAQLFRQHGVHLQKGERGGDSTVAEWLLGDLWIDPAHPKYRITTACPWLIWELGQQRYKELSAQVALHANASETFVDKDNHAYDSLKMFLKRFPPAARPRPAAQQPASFMWWRQQALAAKRGEPMKTYRRAMVS